MRKRRQRPLSQLLFLYSLASLVGLAVAHFSVHDDVHAYPQYRVAWADTSISPQSAQELLSSQSDDKSYHIMKLNSSTFLCTLPYLRSISSSEDNTTSLSHAEEEKERLRARKKGWDLLRPLEGNCMYLNTGWWTYAFCHNRYVKQFHALPPGNQVPSYPPVQDPTTEHFILGQTPANERHSDAELYGQPPSQLDEGLTSVDAIGEQRYLVQKMGGGTWCELIKKNRRIEVQFQCDPQGGDKLAWVKETSTCSYLMVIHTAKLCNDLAFVPVKRVGEGEGVHEVLCRKVLEVEEMQQPVLELPPGATKDSIEEEATTVEDEEEKTTTTTTQPAETENTEAADYLEFVIPPGPLPSALTLLEETITQQIADGKFLRPDGELYSPEDEDPIEYRVELVDDEEDRVFGVLRVKISKGAKVEAEILTGDGKEDVLPESLRKELEDFVEGRVVGRPEANDNENRAA